MEMVIRGVMILIALFFTFFAVQLMFTPEPMAAGFYLTPIGADGLNTVRGDLGGAFLAMAVFAALGARPGAAHWLLAAATVVGAIALGRIVGLAMDGISDSAINALVAEIVIVVLLVIGHRRLSSVQT